MLDFDRFTLLINLIFEVSVFVLRWRDIKLWEQLDTQLPISWLLDFAHEFQKKKKDSRVLQLSLKIILPYVELIVVRLDLVSYFRFLWSAHLS